MALINHQQGVRKLLLVPASARLTLCCIRTLCYGISPQEGLCNVSLVDHREALSFVARSVDHKTTLYSVDAKVCPRVHFMPCRFVLTFFRFPTWFPKCRRPCIHLALSYWNSPRGSPWTSEERRQLCGLVSYGRNVCDLRGRRDRAHLGTGTCHYI
jgi:hypothetical protein